MPFKETVVNFYKKIRVFWLVIRLLLPASIVICLILYPFLKMPGTLTAFAIQMLLILVVLVIVGLLGYRRVEEGKVALVERLGNYNRPIEPGPNWIIPIIEDLAFVQIGKHRVQYIDLREQIHDIRAQNVFTSDRVPINIDTILFWRIDKIEGAIKVAYQIRNVVDEIDRLVHTSIRDMLADIEFDIVFSKAREIIKEKLSEYMKEESNRWGIKIIKVDVEDIKPTDEMRQTLERVAVAKKERDKEEIQAEAKRIKARGDRDAKIIEAEAEAESIQKIFRAIKKENPDNNLIAIRYLDALQKIADGKANKVFMPFQASNLLSSLGAIRELDGKQIQDMEKDLHDEIEDEKGE